MDDWDRMEGGQKSKGTVDTRFNYLDETRGKDGQFTGKKTAYLMSPTLVYKPEPLGELLVDVFGETVHLIGGPYVARPEGTIGVKMAEEIDRPFDVNVPTRDFQTPNPDVLMEGLLAAVSGHIILRKPIYVGCMAGRGRTGLFMAALVYLSGDDEPVRTVRSEYYAHAVETEKQEAFVRSLDRGTFRRQLAKVLLEHGAINFTRLRRMKWLERLAVFRMFVAPQSI